MLVKKIKFTDFDGNEREQEYYFHMNKAEVAEWLMCSGNYTLDKVLIRLTQTQNAKEIMELYKDIIHRSYGVKSLDGISFDKTEEAWNRFYHSEAYSVLFMELVSDASKFSEFINQIIPKDLSDDIDKIMKENRDSLPDYVKEYLPKIEEGKVTPIN